MLNNITGILSTMFSMSIPLILAALGGVYSVRSGIMALGLESMILTGAFTAAVGSFYSGASVISLWLTRKSSTALKLSSARFICGMDYLCQIHIYFIQQFLFFKMIIDQSHRYICFLGNHLVCGLLTPRP